MNSPSAPDNFFTVEIEFFVQQHELPHLAKKSTSGKRPLAIQVFQQIIKVLQLYFLKGTAAYLLLETNFRD
ncbi:hypothetical protein D770_20180 [Flammeovirgaceae bacterium 311]|nr:hypothetical protein D770_20180 [Flammeovirgaceae bacterium 311]